MKVKTLVISLALAALPAVGSAATCARADLTGTWMIYTDLGAVARCKIVMPATGTAIGTGSTCWVPGVANVVPFTGSLSIAANCRVTGSISAGGQQRTVDGWISKGKDSISGMGYNTADVAVGRTFSGVKQ